MSIVDAFFSFNGKLTRLQYLWSIVLSAFIMVVLVFAGAAAGANLNVGASIVFYVLAFVFYFWSSLAIPVKRLHDMGLPGTHLIWIIGLNMITASLAATGVGIVFSIISFCVALWLLFTPSKVENV